MSIVEFRNNYLPIHPFAKPRKFKKSNIDSIWSKLHTNKFSVSQELSNANSPILKNRKLRLHDNQEENRKSNSCFLEEGVNESRVSLSMKMINNAKSQLPSISACSNSSLKLSSTKKSSNDQKIFKIGDLNYSKIIKDFKNTSNHKRHIVQYPQVHL